MRGIVGHSLAIVVLALSPAAMAHDPRWERLCQLAAVDYAPEDPRRRQPWNLPADAPLMLIGDGDGIAVLLGPEKHDKPQRSLVPFFAATRNGDVFMLFTHSRGGPTVSVALNPKNVKEILKIPIDNLIDEMRRDPAFDGSRIVFANSCLAGCEYSLSAPGKIDEASVRSMAEAIASRTGKTVVAPLGVVTWMKLGDDEVMVLVKGIDGKILPAHQAFVVVTPQNDGSTRREYLSDIRRLFQPGSVSYAQATPATRPFFAPPTDREP